MSNFANAANGETIGESEAATCRHHGRHKRLIVTKPLVEGLVVRAAQLFVVSGSPSRAPACPGPSLPQLAAYPPAVSSISRAQLDAMAEEATVDCYNEAEQLTGFFTMIHDNLAAPFETYVVDRER